MDILGLLILFALAYAIIIAIGTLKLLQLLLHPERITYANALTKGWPTQPAELQLNATEEIHKFEDSSESPYWNIQGEKQNGPIIIFTHGWSSGRYIALMKATLFTPYASRVILYDLRAHGDNTAKQSKLGTQETDDLLHLMNTLDQDNTPFILMGSSMGGGISIAAASRDFQAGNHRILGVFADGAYDDPLEPIKGQIRFRKMPVFPMVQLAYYHFKFWHNNLKDFHRAKHAASIPVPLCLVHGDQDPICPLEEGQMIADAAPQGWLVQFPGGQHGGLATLNLELYQNTLQVFFNKINISTTQKVNTHE